MDSVNDKKITEPFPFESLYRIRNAVLPQPDISSDYTARSYDNRGRISDMAAALRSRLGYFQTRLSANPFLSNGFEWQVKTAQSSDPSLALAKAMNGASKENYSFEIEAIAGTRTAVSKQLAADNIADFETGTYAFTLTVNDESHEVELDIENSADSPLTNRTLLRQLERAINSLGAGVTARMEDTQKRDYNPYRENAYKEISYLTVQSESTGSEIEFSLSDSIGSDNTASDNTGTLIQDLDLDRVTRFGNKNIYRVNGSPDRSDSNNVVIEEGALGGYLLGTTDTGENVRISIEQGREALAEELELIITDYNELIQWIDDNDSIISPGLKQELFRDLDSISVGEKSVIFESIDPGEVRETDPKEMFGFTSRLNIDDKNSIDDSLADIGLTINPGGTLEIEDGFAQSVNADLLKVYETLGGENGFFTKISNRIESIQDSRESSYLFTYNSILSYDPQGTNRQSIYKGNVDSIISFFV